MKQLVPHKLDDRTNQWCKTCRCFTDWAPCEIDSIEETKFRRKDIFSYACTTCLTNTRYLLHE